MRSGTSNLVIKISKAPLEQDLRGISIFSNGVWHETTLAGSENKEMAQYIFGEIEVPKLDDDKSPIAPFDISRSMRLNPENEIVRALYAFIGQRVEVVRRALAEEDKKRKSEEEMKRLTKQAAEIARVINEDFDAFRQQVAKVRAKTSGGLDAYRLAGNGTEENSDTLFGNEVPAEIICPPVHGDRPVGPEPAPPRPPVVTPADPDAEKLGQACRRRWRTETARRISSSIQGNGRGVRPSALRKRRSHDLYQFGASAASRRDWQSATSMTRCFGGSPTKWRFLNMLLPWLLSSKDRGHYIDPSDPIVDIRRTLNRLARKAALLYSEQRAA